MNLFQEVAPSHRQMCVSGERGAGACGGRSLRLQTRTAPLLLLKLFPRCFPLRLSIYSRSCLSKHFMCPLLRSHQKKSIFFIKGKFCLYI